MVGYDIEQCVGMLLVFFAFVVGGKAELIMAVHVDDIVTAGSDEACRDFHAGLNTKYPRITSAN